MRVQLPKSFTAKVVGMSFVDAYPQNILSLSPGLELRLCHNPDNEHDENAIEVWCADDMLGHLPRDAARRMAAEIRAGLEWAGCIVEILIDPNHTTNPGLMIRCERKSDG